MAALVCVFTNSMPNATERKQKQRTLYAVGHHTGNLCSKKQAGVLKQYLGGVAGSKEGIKGHGCLTDKALKGGLGCHPLGDEPIHQLLQCCIIHPRVGRQCLFYEVMHLQIGQTRI